MIVLVIRFRKSEMSPNGYCGDVERGPEDLALWRTAIGSASVTIGPSDVLGARWVS
jgi:hypothetical protein